MSSVRSVPLTKDETLLLVQLVAANKIITNKATNAANNQLKEEAWSRITDQFNASISSCPRTPAQLRLKWENMKKAARKRAAAIRINQFKTGGGKPDFVSPDEALDQVAAILGATCDGYSVVYGGDADRGEASVDLCQQTIENLPVVISGGGCDGIVEESVVNKKICGSFGDRVTVPITTPTKKFLFGASNKSKDKFRDLKRKATDEMSASTILRNTTTAKYYEAKTKVLLDCTVDKENIHKEQKLELEDIKLKLNNYVERLEHLELENKKLRLELDQLKNKI